MYLHIDEAYEFLDRYLPKHYTKEVVELLNSEDISVSDGVIKNVRNKITVRLDVLNALVTVAKKNKEREESLIKLIQ